MIRPKISYEALLKVVLGRSRSDPKVCAKAMIAGRNIAQASTRQRPAQRDAAETSLTGYNVILQDKGFGAISTEVRPAGEFYYAEAYHQQYLAKNPQGYCGIGGTGVSCPIGLKMDAHP